MYLIVLIIYKKIKNNYNKLSKKIKQKILKIY